MIKNSLKRDVKTFQRLIRKNPLYFNAGIKAYKTNPKFTAAQTDIETLSIIKADDHLFVFQNIIKEKIRKTQL